MWRTPFELDLLRFPDRGRMYADAANSFLDVESVIWATWRIFFGEV